MAASSTSSSFTSSFFAQNRSRGGKGSAYFRESIETRTSQTTTTTKKQQKRKKRVGVVVRAAAEKGAFLCKRRKNAPPAMILRTETDMGSTELKLYKGASGATVSTALGAVTETVAASNAVEFDFTSVSNTYSKGDTMAIRVDPTDDPDGGQNITIELVFDLTT